MLVSLLSKACTMSPPAFPEVCPHALVAGTVHVRLVEDCCVMVHGAASPTRAETAVSRELPSNVRVSVPVVGQSATCRCVGVDAGVQDTLLMVSHPQVRPHGVMSLHAWPVGQALLPRDVHVATLAGVPATASLWRVTMFFTTSALLGAELYM